MTSIWLSPEFQVSVFSQPLICGNIITCPRLTRFLELTSVTAPQSLEKTPAPCLSCCPQIRQVCFNQPQLLS